MNIFALDTDILSLYRKGHTQVVERVGQHPLSELAITVITVEEHLTGWYTVLRQAKKREQIVRAYQELAESVSFLGGWPILRFTEPAVVRYEDFRAMKLGVRAADLRIAAIAVEHGATVVTRNTRDFKRVPNLSIEDWTQ